MKVYGSQQENFYETITDIVLLPVTFGTLIYLIYFTVKTKSTMFYSRMILAMLIQAALITLSFTKMAHLRPDFAQVRRLDLYWFVFWDALGQFSIYIRGIPTYLYCWQ